LEGKKIGSKPKMGYDNLNQGYDYEEASNVKAID
jgi:hypothetical protein